MDGQDRGGQGPIQIVVHHRRRKSDIGNFSDKYQCYVHAITTVSYTHLDVYKRQVQNWPYATNYDDCVI